MMRVGPSGAPVRRRIRYPALRRAGLRSRTMYQTRDTLATLMRATGEDSEWIAKQLGHTSPDALLALCQVRPNVTHRDGATFLEAYRGWFDGQGRGDADTPKRAGAEGGPLGALYDTFTPPHKKRVRLIT